MAGLNVVSFDAKAQRRQEVIDLAQDSLRMVAAGEITDLAFAASGLDGSVKTAYTTTDDAQRRLTAVSRLLFRFHQAAERDNPTWKAASACRRKR